MEPIIFETEEKNKEFQKCLKGVYPDPYIIAVRNENGGVQPVSLFNKSYTNPGIAINCPLPNLTYEELCFLFLQPVSIGLIAVRIIKCEDEDNIMGYLKFDFLDKDGRREISHSPVFLYDDPRKFEQVVFLPIDILIRQLTYIDFSLPKGAEIELMLFEKQPFKPDEPSENKDPDTTFGS